MFQFCSGTFSSTDLVGQIIPRAVDYFTGKALEFDGEDLDDDDDDDDDEEDDDDVFEDEDEVCLSKTWYYTRISCLFSFIQDSDEDSAPKRRNPPKSRGTGGNQNVNADECKQQ